MSKGRFLQDATSIAIIGGADGPTSIIVGRRKPDRKGPVQLYRFLLRKVAEIRTLLSSKKLRRFLSGVALISAALMTAVHLSNVCRR